MTKKKMTLSDRAIRSMPYEMRLRNYEREKNTLFDKSANMSTASVAKAHAELAAKWRV